MKKKMINCPNPSCQSPIELELPEIEALEQQLKEKDNTIYQLLEDQKAWHNGTAHVTFDPERAEQCPKCKEKLDAYFEGKHQERMKNLTMEQKGEYAKAWGLYPPPSIEIPNNLFRRQK